MLEKNPKIKDSFILADNLLQKFTMPAVKKLETLLHGDFSSIFHGHGLDFKEIREYTDQDDIRNIDWNVTARMNKPHVRVYGEDKEHIVWFVIDTSPSMEFGSDLNTKKDILMQIIAIIGYLSYKRGAKTGAIFFNNEVEVIIPPDKGLKHLYCILQKLINYENTDKNPDGFNISRLSKIIGRKKSVFFLSDFIFSDHSWKKTFGEICLKNEITAVEIVDPVEESIPDVGYINLIDPETGNKAVIDTSDKKILENYKKLVAEETADKNKLFSLLKINPVKIYTNSDITEVLIDYSRKAMHRRRA